MLQGDSPVLNCNFDEIEEQRNREVAVSSCEVPVSLTSQKARSIFNDSNIPECCLVSFLRPVGYTGDGHVAF